MIMTVPRVGRLAELLVSLLHDFSPNCSFSCRCRPDCGHFAVGCRCRRPQAWPPQAPRQAPRPLYDSCYCHRQGRPYSRPDFNRWRHAVPHPRALSSSVRLSTPPAGSTISATALARSAVPMARFSCAFSLPVTPASESTELISRRLLVHAPARAASASKTTPCCASRIWSAPEPASPSSPDSTTTSPPCSTAIPSTLLPPEYPRSIPSDSCTRQKGGPAVITTPGPRHPH